MRMTRRVTFSSGHRYWIPSLSEDENRALFGRWASPYNHGHNYVLEVGVEGEVDENTGMVVNIKWVDDILKQTVIAEFDQKSINDEIEWFRSRSSSLENLLLYLLDRLKAEDAFAKLPEISLQHLRLEEHPLLWAEYDVRTQLMTLTRVYEFAASHRLHAEHLPQEENLRLYGKCNNPAGHGHNYVLEVTVEGTPDEKTGMMVDLGALDKSVEDLVLNRYDHKNLNVDVPELSDKITTSEVVAQAIFDALNGKLPAKLNKVRLHETARNVFEVSVK